MAYMGNQLSSVIFTPIQIIIGVILMYHFIGPSFLSGIGMMIVMIVITYFFAKKTVKYNDQVLKVKD
jgi:hypothetical protein